ncbi:aminodeoxychorismate/anthranilate synthase component II [Ferroplasma sp.]|uniref:anthranilate synthase component II n=1 Tax=Ferroplasma sp. TaxID=2591003 RepID=UPI00307EBF4A
MKRILIIDNFDSFVYNIYQYIASSEVHVDVKANNDLNNAEGYDGYIISPGPGNPERQEDRGNLYEFIDRNRSAKFLGVCFGNQILGYYLGSSIVLSKRLMHGQPDIIVHGDSPLYRNVPEKFTAIRYHSLVLNGTKNIVVDAYSQNDKEIMGFHSKDGNLFGVQYHPESYYSEYGKIIFKNFIDAL